MVIKATDFTECIDLSKNIHQSVSGLNLQGSGDVESLKVKLDGLTEKLENLYTIDASYKLGMLNLAELERTFNTASGRELFKKVLDICDDSLDFDACAFMINTKEGFEYHIKNNAGFDAPRIRQLKEMMKYEYFMKDNKSQPSTPEPDETVSEHPFSDYAYTNAVLTNAGEKFGSFALIKKKMMAHHYWFQNRIAFALTMYLWKNSLIEKLEFNNRELKLKNHQLAKEKFLSDERDHAFERLLRVAYDPQDDKFKNEIKGILKRALNVDASFYLLKSNEDVQAKIEEKVEQLCRTLDIKVFQPKILVSVKKLFLFENKAEESFSLENGEQISISYIPIRYFSFAEEKSDIPVGTLIVVRKGLDPNFSSREDAFLETISDMISIITEYTNFYRVHQKNKEMMYEFKTAGNIQANLLPKEFPESEVFDVYGISQFYKYVGGDFYNVFGKGTGKLKCVVGDVCGKGLSAALMANLVWSQFMALSKDFIIDKGILQDKIANLIEKKGALSQSEIQMLINSSYRDAGTNEVFNNLNNKITEFLDDYSFVTMVYIIFDEKNRKLELSNAGHMPVILYRPEDSSTIHLGKASPPIGLEADLDFARQELTNLKPGDVFVVYTDGVIEARLGGSAGTDENIPIEDRIFGMERLEDLVRQNAHRSSEEIVNTVIKNVMDFSGNQFNDDVTLVVIKVKV